MSQNKKNNIIFIFLTVPIISSFISTIHIIKLFDLGNENWMSILLAITYELGSIFAFILPTILTKINRYLIYSVFFILIFMQILGNVFFSYDFIFNKLNENPVWLDSFFSFLNNFIFIDFVNVNFILSLLIGVPIPIISLFFLKSLINYLDFMKIEKNEFIYKYNEDDDNVPFIQNNNIK